MTMSVRSCLSYDLSNAILSSSKIVYFKEKMHCCHERRHGGTCSRESDNTRVVITIFMTRLTATSFDKISINIEMSIKSAIHFSEEPINYILSNFQRGIL